MKVKWKYAHDFCWYFLRACFNWHVKTSLLKAKRIRVYNGMRWLAHEQHAISWNSLLVVEAPDNQFLSMHGIYQKCIKSKISEFELQQIFKKKSPQCISMRSQNDILKSTNVKNVELRLICIDVRQRCNTGIKCGSLSKLAHHTSVILLLHGLRKSILQVDPSLMYSFWVIPKNKKGHWPLSISALFLVQNLKIVWFYSKLSPNVPLIKKKKKTPR